ncbi:hypothetical protein CCAX7_55670 [Capsulimonas corticalis]|uniref:Uncharacterized protein n=1 Tax=Capsulimonas corticalis TaxID=2219043 RepID=A0A402D0R6_9BACT|nr:hypothetical protein [Capsulimonas corticalis]BDI33516.1 hypothetical protein CCAX7_55670 [Capsulimonas corticalis]
MSTSVTVMEASKRQLFSKGYMLAITAVIDNPYPLESEMRHVNEAMIQWLKSRKNAAWGLTFVFTASPQQETAIQLAISHLLLQDFEWKPQIDRLRDIRILLLDGVTKTSKELVVRKS